MRFFLDANVLASAIYTNGNEEALFRTLLKPENRGLTSAYVLEEVRRTQVEKFHRPPEEASRVVSRLGGLLEIVPDGPLTNVGPRSDRPVLGAAIHGSADFLVTGDRALLHLKRMGQTAIVRAADALRILGLTPKRY